jgi:anti-sigma factor RsiW
VSTANSSKANHGEASVPPTDLELMLYVDGELDEARHRQVEEYVLLDPRCRAKVAALVTAADMVRDSALASSAADGIADGVMAKILEGQGGVARAEGDSVVRPVASPPSGDPPRARARLQGSPANDNARGIFALTALAVAAAAALMVWGKMGVETPTAELTRSAPSALLAPPPAAPSALPEAPAKEPAAAPSVEGEVEPGVEIAAVDFGARMGTIFYVPREAVASGPATTVVWLSDDGPGGQ